MTTLSNLQPIWIYDTTLRDGAQREGLSLSLDDKLRIVRRLDQLGVPFIEGGWPGANPKDVQFFWHLKEQPLTQAALVAFCSTRRPHTQAADDPMIQAILSAGTQWICFFGKSWDLHVTEGLHTTLEENLAMIADTAEYFCTQGRRIMYDAEHWFDGYKQNPEYALSTLDQAVQAGAEWVVLCDTNGGTLPYEITAIVRDVKAHFQQHSYTVKLGIHPHNDSDTAVANAIAAVQEGAHMVQGTINGYGERCGNANLCSVIPNLQLKLGYSCLAEDQLANLTETSRFVSEVVNLAPNHHAPFVGRSAFAHKGGIHVSAVARNPLTYEHLQPEKIGNQRRIVVSDQAGLSNILAKARSFGIELDKHNPACRQILERLKDLENQGYQFEGAEASFELLMRSALGQAQSWFEIKGFNVHCDMGSPTVDPTMTSNGLATIKVRVNERNFLEVAEGNGPVAALDAALRKALVKFYPEIGGFYLTDYKVRILDGTAGTSAKTRVLVESSDGLNRWTTVGVSTNILDASYQAVVEGLEYGLLLVHQAQEKDYPQSIDMASLG
ncbi:MULTISPECIES: citramalate synthase [unclassified Roseofilum]|uniref:citramalate synthase n=1 Tax=unclassified Roseofilum TaxID=2620099 RepID=UPI001AFD4A71|nr:MULTISPECIES: citramalate synthase [unclassified Roseofilum]MBP0011473.1 citramalate synthase [Roseofilum sp. Belize Diploria]MBP0014312.1 citramalate synthase [Roseofilum sp. SID3]MBP0025331.1 citramalate synthase [Roseofilum sp. SID2]MBP0036042.1 citramalate synthase [Roseofilum sp. Belize BBD 4]MBP0036186.1 citramalate synthase [Roseofilum sp. SID1]